MGVSAIWWSGCICFHSMIDDRIELCCCSSVLLAIRSVAEREREREGLDSGSERGIVVYNGMFFLNLCNQRSNFVNSQKCHSTVL